MHARVSFLLHFVVAAASFFLRAQAFGYLQEPPNNQTVPTSPPFPAGIQTDDIVFQSFTFQPDPQGTGKSARLVGRFRFNRFPSGAKDMYCAMRNYNASLGATVAIVNRKASARPKLQKKYKVVEDETIDRIQWTFKGDQQQGFVGKTWTLSAKVRLNQFTTLDAYTWRFYCETKQDPGTISWYYFKWWETIGIVQYGTDGKGKSYLVMVG